MTIALDLLISAALVVGGLFGLIGSFGLLKLRGTMQRLHAPTKATTIGVGSVLIASAFDSIIATGAGSWHEILVTAFLFLTAPLTAFFLAKVHLLTIPPADVPPTGTPQDWANRDWANQAWENRDAPARDGTAADI